MKANGFLYLVINGRWF